MQPKLRLGPKHVGIIATLRDHLVVGDIRHIRLVGEAGVGKTRLSLEATRSNDLASTVIYVGDGATFLQSPLFSELLRKGDARTAILVIDECPNKERASIWNALRSKSDRLRLITIDHGPDDAGGDDMLVISVPPIDRARIEEILADYGISKHEAERWARFCIGSPRVAHVLGENLRRNPKDILRNPSNLDVWDKFIIGADNPTLEDVQLRKIALAHISLFQRFGFEAPVQAEAQFIAELAERADARLSWPRFQSIIYDLKTRRLLQGGTLRRYPFA